MIRCVDERVKVFVTYVLKIKYQKFAFLIILVLVENDFLALLILESSLLHASWNDFLFFFTAGFMERLQDKKQKKYCRKWILMGHTWLEKVKVPQVSCFSVLTQQFDEYFVFRLWLSYNDILFKFSNFIRKYFYFIHTVIFCHLPNETFCVQYVTEYSAPVLVWLTTVGHTTLS